MRYRVFHETVYEYARPVITSHNEGRVFPRRLDRQQPDGLELRVEPTPDHLSWHRDYFGNDAVFFSLEEPHERLAITATSTVDVASRPELDPGVSPAWEEVAARVRSERDPRWVEAFEFAFDSAAIRTGHELRAYAAESFQPRRPLAEAALDLTRRIHAEFKYDQTATTVATRVEDALRGRYGVCQDFAHVMIGSLRSLGLPARYVSGYLRSRNPTPPAVGTPLGEGDVALVGAEASHAWVSVFCPVLGWLDLDPTNDLVVSDRHVVLAWGRDFEDVSPVKGVALGGGAHTVKVRVEVLPPELATHG